MPKYLDGAGLSHFWESIKPKLGGVVQSGTGTVVTSDDAANLPPLSLTIHGKSVQDGTPSPSSPAEIRSVEGLNLLDFSSITTQTFYGITFTMNDDGSIHVSGTATGTAYFYLSNSYTSNNLITVPVGTYTLSVSGIASGVHVIFSGARDNGFGYFELTADGARTSNVTVASKSFTYIVVRVNSGATVDTTVRMQLESGSAAHHWQPYQSIKAAITGRNMLPKGNTTTSAGVSYTVRDDGSVLASGTATATSFWASMVYLPAGRYTTSGCPAGGSDNTYCLTARDAYSGTLIGSSYANDYGSGGYFVLDSDSAVRLNIHIQSGYTANNLVFYPQIEYGSEATEYEPYTDASAFIPLQGHALRSLPDGTEDTLEVDGEGNVTLTQRIGSTTTATTDGITATVDTDAMSTTGTLADGATVIYKLATPQTIDLGKIDLPSLPSPSFSIHVDAAVTPTLDAEWFTEGGGRVIDAVSTRITALESEVDSLQADVTELQGQVPEREVLYDTSTWTIVKYGRTVMVQVHGATATPSTSTALVTGILADYKPAYNCSATVLTSSGSSTQAARLAVYADTGNVYIVPAGYSSSASWYGTLTYIY